MKNESSLKQLPNSEILEKISALAAEERRVTMALIEYLREVERRMLYAELGFSSLFEFCVKFLGLSEGSAGRRIAAMRLVRDVPEIKASLEKGTMTLSKAAQVQSFFQAEKKLGIKRDVADKKEILQKVVGLSHRESEKALLSINPSLAQPQEKARVLTDELVELKFSVSDELMQKIGRLKEMMGRAASERLFAELLEFAVDEKTKEFEKKRFGTQSVELKEEKQSSKTISVTIKRTVWSRAKGQCEFHSDAGVRCQSRSYLEIDHRTPRAIGGTHELKNLRLLCSTHNKSEAVRILGREAMKPYMLALG